MSNAEPGIRFATPQDAAGMLAIYGPIVETTAFSFEEQLPTLGEYRGRIEEITQTLPWLAFETGGRIAGFAYASTHRGRAAYRWSVETSVYVDESFRKRGIGGGLYAALFELLIAQNYANALAGITLPNDISVRFHRQIGFEPIGTYPGIGYKFGQWRDVEWMNKRLRGNEAPAEPLPVSLIHRDIVQHAFEHGESKITGGSASIRTQTRGN